MEKFEMTREGAIKVVEKLQEPVESHDNLEGTGLQYPVRIPPEEVCLGEKEHEALTILRFTAKRYGELIEKLRIDMDYLEGRLDLNDDACIELQTIKYVYDMLTKEEK